jgi:hypothetical protein
MDAKHQTITVVAGQVSPHITEFGMSRRVSLVGVINDAEGEPTHVVHLTGIVDLNHESVEEYDWLDHEEWFPKQLQLLGYDGKPA